MTNTQWNEYIEIARQYKHPSGAISKKPIICREWQARQSIGTTQEDNPSWFIEDMILIQSNVKI